MPVDAFHGSCNYHMVSLLELSSNLHTAEMGPNRASSFRPCKASSEGFGAMLLRLKASPTSADCEHGQACVVSWVSPLAG
eukprot:10900982-Alexandrium_andersonii.AAC.1